MYKQFSLLVGLIFVVLVFAGAAIAQLSIPGQVVEVIDGKTVILSLQTGKVMVELQYIDVPESGQQMNELVTAHLRRLVLGKTVNYRTRSILSDRVVGHLTLMGVDLSQQMLRDGAAWLIPSEASGQDAAGYNDYSQTEAAAKNEGLGIWSVPGLKPGWQFRAEKKESERSKEQFFVAPDEPKVQRPATAKGYWSDKNPNINSYGPLVNGYNAESKKGFISTSYLPVSNLGGTPLDAKMVLDITYWYKEDDKSGRNGIFVITLVSESDKYQFLSENDLFLTDNGKTTNVGKAKRTVSDSGGNQQETLSYRLSKSTIEKLANSDSTYIKIGQHTFFVMNGRYLLVNMLDMAR